MWGTLLAAVTCTMLACTSPGATASGNNADGRSISGNRVSGDAAGPMATWPTYGQNPAHTGVATGVRPAGPLGIRWRASLDGAVYGQPLVVGGDVIAATENDTVYALNASTGKVAWRRHLGTPVPQSALHGCGDIFPLGITGTPAYDQADGLVYAVTESSGYKFTLSGLSASSGAVRITRTINLTTSTNDPAWDQQRPALTIADGRVYAAFGGLAGDCGTYTGGVAGIPLTGKGSQVTYFTPTSRKGAVWGTAGPVAGPHGDLWISVGNGAATGGRYDGSDSVTTLSPALRRTGLFAPSVWADDNASDQDLGSTQPALAAGSSTLIVGKRGTGYLLNTASLGGIGGQRAAAQICPAYGAAAANWADVYEPCRDGGVTAVAVNQAKKQIRVLWHGPGSAAGSPVLGGGAVWATDYGVDPGVLYELDPATGHIRHQISLGARLPHFSSLSLSGSTAYVSTLGGVIAVSGA